MEPSVRDLLCGLIRRYGHGLSDDPARCQGILNDLLRGEHKREVFVLISALKAGVADDLLRDGSAVPAQLLLDRLRQRLEHDLAMTDEAAHWAVETWALALGIVDASVRVLDPEMVAIPAGRFQMGSLPDRSSDVRDELPQHWVEIPAFELGRYAVTFDEWDACVAAGGCIHKPDDQGWGRGRHPVINVSWDDAQGYVRWLSRATGKTYRLPSEAEWEYACRAGTTTPFSTGLTIDISEANYDGLSDIWIEVADPPLFWNETRPVGTYPQNPWGLYEMNGNVLEWIEDCWNPNYINAPADGSAWRTGNCLLHVIRGGSWYHMDWALRSASRGNAESGSRDKTVGFRVARTLTR